MIRKRTEPHRLEKSDLVRQVALSSQENKQESSFIKDPFFWGSGLVAFALVFSCCLGAAGLLASHDEASSTSLQAAGQEEPKSAEDSLDPLQEESAPSIRDDQVAPRAISFSLPSTRAFEEARAAAQGITNAGQKSAALALPQAQFGLKPAVSARKASASSAQMPEKQVLPSKDQAKPSAAPSNSSSLEPETPKKPSAPKSEAQAKPAEERISISISSSAVGGSVSYSGSLLLKNARTPYEALSATGLSINARSSQFGIYVAAIGGLAEKEHGASSGWMYSVNGQVPMQSASSFTLKAGDRVSWFYVR